MEREENESNHDQGMTLASPALAVHDQEVADASSHEPQADDEKGAYRDVGGSHCQGNTHREDHVEKTRRPALTLWIKPDARGDVHATGFFDRDDNKFALRFTRFDHALERIGSGDAAWHSFANREVGADLLPAERQATGIAASATMSGLYATKDTWARKEPLFNNKAVALTWNGEEPAHAFLIEGEEVTQILLRRETSDRYKGIIL